MTRIFHIGHDSAKLTCCNTMGILLLAPADNMSAEVELLAVVWEVKESALYSMSSSSLLSSSPEIDSGERDQSMKKHWVQQG